jgi:hypothetical protein
MVHGPRVLYHATGVTPPTECLDRTSTARWQGHSHTQPGRAGMTPTPRRGSPRSDPAGFESPPRHVEEHHDRLERPYLSDLSDQQWALIEPLIPVNETGRPRIVEMREVLNTIFFLNRTGCQWDMLPHDLPAKSTACDHFSQGKSDGTWQRSCGIV